MTYFFCRVSKKYRCHEKFNEGCCGELWAIKFNQYNLSLLTIINLELWVISQSVSVLYHLNIDVVTICVYSQYLLFTSIQLLVLYIYKTAVKMIHCINMYKIFMR